MPRTPAGVGEGYSPYLLSNACTMCNDVLQSVADPIPEVRRDCIGDGGRSCLKSLRIRPNLYIHRWCAIERPGLGRLLACAQDDPPDLIENNVFCHYFCSSGGGARRNRSSLNRTPLNRSRANVSLSASGRSSQPTIGRALRKSAASPTTVQKSRQCGSGAGNAATSTRALGSHVRVRAGLGRGDNAIVWSGRLVGASSSPAPRSTQRPSCRSRQCEGHRLESPRLSWTWQSA